MKAMKKSVSLTTVLLLAACAGSGDKTGDSQNTPAVGMANPASVFCVEKGGRLEAKKDADGGEYALCHLPDGRVIEEWEYFCANHKQ